MTDATHATRTSPSPGASGQRWLPLEGALNARDLGGLPTRDGRITRTGVLMRTDTLQELTESDVKWFAALPLRTVLDLRTPVETEREGRGRLADTDTAYINFSFISNELLLPRDETDRVIVRDRLERQRVDHYLDYLSGAPDQVAGALALLAEPGTTPAVFHCAAGKDRTGVLTALLLTLADVEREVIAADYALTNERIHLVAARLRRLGTYSQGVKQVPDERLAADPATMRDFLAAIDERWGGVREWTRQAGLDEATIDRLGQLLLEP